MFAVHVGGMYNCVRSVLPGMIERRWGRIVSTSSYGALAGGGKVAHYCAAKAGIIGLTVALAAELLPLGITVNTVAPGIIDTAMFRNAPERWREAILRATPLGKPGKPEDIARVVVFLAAEEAGFITGQVISPNGGVHMVWT
jgi:3-oxoacyl-[acyl-carrier protein] reductase